MAIIKLKRPKLTLLEKLYLPAVIKGLAITFKHAINSMRGKTPGAAQFNSSGTGITMQYPEEKRVYGDRFRGRHRLMQREDGTPRCVACQMCSTYCPADCIEIVGGEDPDPTIEKVPLSFDIDLLRCVYCGLCEEACPCDAIRMDTGIYEIAADNREAFVVDMDFLLNNKTDGTRRN